MRIEATLGGGHQTTWGFASKCPKSFEPANDSLDTSLPIKTILVTDGVAFRGKRDIEERQRNSKLLVVLC